MSNEILDVTSLDIKSEFENVSSISEVSDMVIKGSNAILLHKKDSVNENIFDQFLKWIIFRTIDDSWREHLAAMDQLREGIGLRAYAQKNPKNEFKQEAYSMFESMLDAIDAETIRALFSIELVSKDQLETLKQKDLNS